MEKYIIGQDFNTRDWFVYDDETDANVCWCDTEEEAKDFVEKLNGFPTMEEIKRDYNELMEIIKDVRTIEQVKELDGQKKFTIEINGMFINEFLKQDDNGYVCTDKDIEWIRYESYGCLSYIYDRFDGKPMFDVWSDYCYDEFIRDIAIDDLTEELYESAKNKVVKYYKYL